MFLNLGWGGGKWGLDIKWIWWADGHFYLMILNLICKSDIRVLKLYHIRQEREKDILGNGILLSLKYFDLSCWSFKCKKFYVSPCWNWVKFESVNHLVHFSLISPDPSLQMISGLLQPGPSVTLGSFWSLFGATWILWTHIHWASSAIPSTV